MAVGARARLAGMHSFNLMCQSTGDLFKGHATRNNFVDANMQKTCVAQCCAGTKQKKKVISTCKDFLREKT